MRTYTDLRTANIDRQNIWDKDGILDGAYRGNELAGETGEACNIIKKLERERLGIGGSRATVAQLMEEIADVVICADLIALHYGFDLDAAVRAKWNASSAKLGFDMELVETKPSDKLRYGDKLKKSDQLEALIDDIRIRIQTCDTSLGVLHAFDKCAHDAIFTARKRERR